MYAVIETGGKQYKVASGQKLKVERLKAEEGQTINFDQVLMVAGEQGVKLGFPVLQGAKVSAKVLSQGRHKKIKIIKFRRRDHYDRQYGHRQDFTEIEVTGIQS